MKLTDLSMDLRNLFVARWNEYFEDYIEDEIDPYRGDWQDEDVVDYVKGVILYGEQGGKNAFVVDVKNRGVFDRSAFEVIANKLNVPVEKIEEIGDANEETISQAMWNIINEVLFPDAEENTGVELFTYGRMGGYWGTPVDNFDLSMVVDMEEVKEYYILNHEKMEEFFDDYYSEAKEAEIESDISNIDEYIGEYPMHKWMRAFIENDIDEGEKFITEPDTTELEKMRNEINNVIDSANDEYWANQFVDWFAEQLYGEEVKNSKRRIIK